MKSKENTVKRHLPALLCAGLACSQVWAEHAKRSQDLASVADPDVQVIIQWNNDANATNDEAVRTLGGKLLTRLSIIHAGVYRVPSAAMTGLEQLPAVNYISLDRTIKHKLDYSASAINASAALNSNYNGRGVGVAVIDSGLNFGDVSYKNLLTTVTRIVYIRDFIGGNGGDQYGHGDHIAGAIGANNWFTTVPYSTRNLQGIAPLANLLDLRVLNANGQGTDGNVIAAIQAAVSLRSKYNVRVINLSLGRPVVESYTLDPLCQAVEAAWNAGIVVVVSAGNEGRDNTYGEQGYGTIDAPGNDPYVITVGAMKTEDTMVRTDDLIASYSSKGPTQIDHIAKPDLVAPGNRMVSLAAPNSTLLTDYPGNAINKSYYQADSPGGGGTTSPKFFMLSGTSMAAAIVSGAVADLLQAAPSLTPDQVKAVLMQSAYKTFPGSSVATEPTTGQIYTSYYDIFTVGAGYLDLQAALSLAAAGSLPSGSAMSPVAEYNGASGVVQLDFPSGTVTSIWGSRTVWGAQSVWGANNVSSGNTLIGGDRTVWGAQTQNLDTSVNGTRCIWGARSVWGASTPSSESLAVSINGEQ
jgi:serine protease AprX